MKRAKCLLLFALAFAGSAFAADTVYTWTGTAGDGKWSTPNNWDKGSGYPSAASHIAQFTKSATVTVDTGAQVTIGYIKVTAGDVTLNGTAGSYLTLDHAVSSGSTGYEDGFVVMPGCTLTMNVPMESTTRVDKWRNGTVVFTAPYTNTGTSYPLLMGQGTNIVAAGGSISLPNNPLQIANGDGDANGYTTVIVQDNGRISAKGISVSIGANSWNAGRVIQDGAASHVEALAGNLEIGKAQKSGTPSSSYVLKNGTLVVGGDIHLGQSGTSSFFRQEGGTSRLNSFIFTNTVGRVELAGGVLYTDRDGVQNRDGATSIFAFSGGTYMTSTNRDVHFNPSRLELSGTPTLQVATGRRFFFPASTTVADDTVFTQSGGSAYIETGIEQEVAGEFIVTNGYFYLNSGSLVPKLNATTPWKLTVQNGGTFFMRQIDSRLALPVDLAISGTGKIQMSNNNSGYYNRSVVIAHSFTRDGVVQPKGRYVGGTSYLDGLAPSSIVVCHVWTGAGDGTSWNDPANWDGNAVPPSGDNTCVDLSRAAGGTITLNDNVTLTFIGFLPSGLERTLTIAGSGTITHHGPAWACGFFVREGCEIVLEANVTRGSATSTLSILGGGRIRVRSTFPGLYRTTTSSGETYLPSYSLDGEVVYDTRIDVSTSGTYKQIGFFTHEAQGKSQIVFADGCSSAADRLNPYRVLHSPAGGFYPADAFVQDGGSLVMNDLFITRHNQAVRTPFSYTLNGGSIDAKYVAVGTHFSSAWDRWGGGSFVMRGGTLTLSENFRTDCNNNHIYLSGGDVYLKGGFIRTTNFPEKRKETNIVETCVHLGGVRIHSTGTWSCALGVQLAGNNGDTTFDTAGYNATFNHAVSGKGGLIKEGAGTLTLAKTNTFTGKIVVNQGIVTMPAGSRLAGPTEIVVNDGAVNLLGEIATAPDSITVPNASSLTIGGDVTVKRYVVGGVPQADGTYTVSGHTLTVASGLGTVWQGVSGGNWSVAGNWSAGVADGASAVADFGASPTLGGGGSVVLDADVTLGKLAFANNVTGTTLTVSGTSTLTMGSEAEIWVGEGQTLVLNAPLSVTQGYLWKKGPGRLVLNGAVAGLSTGAGYYFVTFEGETEVNGTVRDCRLWATNTDGFNEPLIIVGENADIGSYASVHPAWKLNDVSNNGHAVQNGGIVDCNPPAYGFAGRMFAFAHFNGGTGSYTLNGGTLNLYRGYPNYFMEYGNGTFNFLQNGGTFNAFGLYLAKSDAGNTKTSYTLNGGTLVLPTRMSANGTGKTHVALNGGTVRSETSPVLFDTQIPVSLGGEVTFTQSVASAALVVSNTIEGDGTIRQQGPGSLTFAGRNYFTGAAAVDGGTLAFDTPTALTNFTATAGTFKFGAGALPLVTKTKIDLGAAGTLNLDYSGEAVVKELWADGRQRPAGTYSATSGHSVSSRISGTGALVVLEGKASGTVIIVR
ncbi:MAG: autotransporter-associated beta strand repeat-containing protein [Kiritimatiellae bacterium]|nr:autotransporter-associated beta strand repeat-containing protein [Kiritimatiellia bacterium]